MNIVISPHARDRFRERFGTTSQTDPHVYATIRHDVVTALQDGRWSSSKPRWAIPRDSQNPTTSRYVWDPERTRCYPLLRRKRGPDKVWIVATVLEAPEPEVLSGHLHLAQLRKKARTRGGSP